MKVISPLLIKLSFISFIMYNGRSYKENVYESNFGTAYDLYKEAVKKDSSIRLQFVKDYLNKRDDIQVKSKSRGSNSFVSPGARFEFEINIMDMLARDGVGIRCGLAAIDNSLLRLQK